MKTNRLSIQEMIEVLEQVKEMLPSQDYICFCLKRIPIIAERNIKIYQFLGSSKLVKYMKQTGGRWRGIEVYTPDDIVTRAFLMPDHLRLPPHDYNSYHENNTRYINWKIEIINLALKELKNKLNLQDKILH